MVSPRPATSWFDHGRNPAWLLELEVLGTSLTCLVLRPAMLLVVQMGKVWILAVAAAVAVSADLHWCSGLFALPDHFWDPLVRGSTAVFLVARVLLTVAWIFDNLPVHPSSLAHGSNGVLLTVAWILASPPLAASAAALLDRRSTLLG
ncbi:hypothetical protein RHMOL_Rhmol11G0125000 [Rhododendron molle]|uniref:Uncharacterized protein n=1 Tax=Rhododendron molle TaxID=49168 RepID=A0ACC0LSN3_RHOML|nr:hypothetical protein RHMOL_Rhmol11G0125000 [Rhododendron molle]